MMATQVSRRCFCKTVSPPFHSGFNVFHDADIRLRSSVLRVRVSVRKDIRIWIDPLFRSILFILNTLHLVFTMVSVGIRRFR